MLVILLLLLLYYICQHRDTFIIVKFVISFLPDILNN